MRARWLRLLALALLLGGCAVVRAPQVADWQTQIAAVEARSDWELQGKIGLRSASEAGSAFLSTKPGFLSTTRMSTGTEP